MCDGFKQLLLKAKDEGKKIKVFFKYNEFKPIVKSGLVLGVDNKSFTLDETYDGEAVYSYDFIIELREVEG